MSQFIFPCTAGPACTTVTSEQKMPQIGSQLEVGGGGCEWRTNRLDLHRKLEEGVSNGYIYSNYLVS